MEGLIKRTRRSANTLALPANNVPERPIRKYRNCPVANVHLSGPDPRGLQSCFHGDTNRVSGIGRCQLLEHEHTVHLHCLFA